MKKTNSNTKTNTKPTLNEVVGDAAVMITGKVIEGSIRQGNGVQSFRVDVARKTPKGNIAHSFINCKTFDFEVEDGDMILGTGYISTGSYDGKNGKVYTTDVILDNIKAWEV